MRKILDLIKVVKGKYYKKQVDKVWRKLGSSNPSDYIWNGYLLRRFMDYSEKYLKCTYNF